MTEADYPTIAHRFLHLIDERRLDDAAALLAPDVVYVRPVLTGSALIRGRAAVLEMYRTRFLTGARPSYHHRITDYATADGCCFLQGVVPDRLEGSGDLFLCCATFRNGQITRWSAVSGETPLDDLRQVWDLAATT